MVESKVITNCKEEYLCYNKMNCKEMLSIFSGTEENVFAPKFELLKIVDHYRCYSPVVFILKLFDANET